MRALATTFIGSLHSPENVVQRWQGTHMVVVSWLGLLLAVVVSPHDTGSTVCWLKQCAGVSCLGCGLGHSLSCGLRGMFADSLSYHPFGLFILGLFLFTACSSLLPGAQQRVARFMESHPVFFNSLYLAFVAGFVAFGTIRSLLEILDRAL